MGITTKTLDHSLKILLIDDNTEFIFILSSLIKQMGHECISVFDGIEGIKAAKKLIPDVIFCDLGLSEMDGFEVAKKIREDQSLKDVYVVALTGYASDNVLKLAAESGFNLHLTKPIDLAKIESVLSRF